MRTFSRWMPALPQPRPPGVWARVVLYGLGAVALTVAVRAYVRYPLALGVALVGVLAYICVSMFKDRRLAREAEVRRSEDIGTFARAFNRRTSDFDPWVIRATWDALAAWTEIHSNSTPNGRLPLRPTDDLAKLLGIVNEDVENLVEEVATRCGRLLDDTSDNPYYGRVQTVGDVVRFVSHQPRRE